jgi:hypothetical protein
MGHRGPLWENAVHIQQIMLSSIKRPFRPYGNQALSLKANVMHTFECQVMHTNWGEHFVSCGTNKYTHIIMYKNVSRLEYLLSNAWTSLVSPYTGTYFYFIHFVTHIKDIHLHRDITITITRKCCDRRTRRTKTIMHKHITDYMQPI